MKSLRIYNQVFRIEKTVYSIQGVQLPMPVSYRQMLFFVATLFIMLILNKVPPLAWVHLYLLKFIAVPALVAWFFTRKTLDGKAPHRFLWRVLEHHLQGHHFARYQELKLPKSQYYRYDTRISYRH